MDDLDAKYAWHSKSIIGPCRFLRDGSVQCDTMTTCDRCGWNPKVYERRRAVNRARIAEGKRPVVPKEKWWIGSGAFPAKK